MKLLTVFIFYALAIMFSLAIMGLRSSNNKSPKISPKRIKKLLIIGGTGGTGRQLVEQALERDYTVTVLARDPSKLKLNHPQLKILQGDILEYDSVDAAIRGQDAVISALGHKKFFYPTRILSEGTRNLLRAMGNHDVPRLICETSLGIGNSVGRMGLYYTLFVVPVILPFYFWDKTRQEKLIAASKLEWVIVRPGVLTNRKKRGEYRHGPHVGNFIWTVKISRADVADFMLNQINSNTYLRKTVGVCW